jgi:D-tyrosyl-tRNA(Tyr) deacylase
MRALVQRVKEASVVVAGEQVSAMGPGLLVLLGVGKGDTEADVAWLARKVAGLRVFEDAAGKMNLSLLDTHRAAVVVSQFTLYADTRKGNRPSFVEAEEPARANGLYEQFCAALRADGVRVGTGVFGADMQVRLVNDGPVTLMLETPPAAGVATTGRPPGQ